MSSNLDGNTIILVHRSYFAMFGPIGILNVSSVVMGKRLEYTSKHRDIASVCRFYGKC